MLRKYALGGFILLMSVARLSAQDHTIVILSHDSHTIYEFDLKTGKTTNQFVAVNQAHEATITPDGKTIFAAVPEGPHVVVLDGATLKEKSKIESPFFKREKPIGNPPRASYSASPHGVAVNNEGTKLYIGLENSEVPGVVIYDIKSGKVLRKLDLLLNGGHFLAIDPKTDLLYYPHRNDNRVVVIDTKTDKVVKIIPVEGGPVGVDFAPNGDVWLHEDGDGSVTVVDSHTFEVVKVLKTPGKGMGRMAVSPDGRWAASTHRDTGDVALFDARTKEMVANIALQGDHSLPYLGFPLFSPDSKTLYVMAFQGGELDVVDLESRKVTARHKLGAACKVVNSTENCFDPFGGFIRLANGKPMSQK